MSEQMTVERIIQVLTDLLDEERDDEFSMTQGAGRALTEAIKLLDERLANVRVRPNRNPAL